MLFNGISCYLEANFEILLLGCFCFCYCYFLYAFSNYPCGMIDYEGEQYQYPITEDYSPSNQIMPHTCWEELGSRSLISNSYSAVFVSYNCSGFIVGRFDCSICTVPMRDPGLDRCSPSLLPPTLPPPCSCCLVIGRPTLDYPLTEVKHNWDPLARESYPSFVVLTLS